MDKYTAENRSQYIDNMRYTHTHKYTSDIRILQYHEKTYYTDIYNYISNKHRARVEAPSAICHLHKNIKPWYVFPCVLHFPLFSTSSIEKHSF